MKLLIQQRDAQVASLRLMLNQMANYVESASAGDPVKIASSGFSMRQPPVPVGPLPAPANLEITPGLSEGSLEISWSTLEGVRIYDVQTCPDPAQPSGWVTRVQTTKRSVTLSGLPSVSRQCTRVRAVGAAGPGAWSPAIAQTVP